MIRIIVFWGLYWGPLILGNYHMDLTIPSALTEPIGRLGLPQTRLFPQQKKGAPHPGTLTKRDNGDT